MSLFSSMRVSVAGFRAQAKRMSAIADNVSNSDTMGYKAHSLAFTPQINCRGGGGAAPLSKEASNNTFLSLGNNGFSSSLDKSHSSIPSAGSSVGSSNPSTNSSPFFTALAGHFGSSAAPSSSAVGSSRASSGSSPLYTSSGVAAHTLMQLQAQGELQRTDQPLDLALDGDGLLLVRDKSGTLGGVRTGAFHLTKEGRLQDAKGLTLQGWTLPSGTPEGGEATSPAFLGSLGDLENIQLIKPEPLAESTPPEEPDPSNLYGTGWTTKKEADGVYSFHSSANFPERAQEGIRVLRTLVDSLGNEHAVNVELWKNTGATVSLLPDPYNANPSISATYHHRADGSYSTSSHEIGTSYVFDEETGRATITFEDTGATLTLDISDIQATDGGGIPAVEPGGTLSWNFPPMIFEEGTWYVYQNLEVVHSSYGGFSATLKVEKNADGSFRGELYEYNGIFEIEFHFDEDGRVSDHMFTWHAQGDSDPSVGVKQAGSLAEVHCIDRGTDHGTFNVDLSAIRILNRTGADLVVNGSTIKPATSFEGTGSARTASGTAPSGDSSAMVSPSSLSIDENGVLKRLKDDGDWEPVYLLACGQFTAMNSAEERNGVYYATPASGALRTGVSGKDGMGTITSGTLERSTTDLAHELSEMIRAQHAYAANTKVLSTIEDMLTELERL